MSQQNTLDTELRQKAQYYKDELNKLLEEKKEIERQLIILEEQINPYRDQIQELFGTLDTNELNKVLTELESELKKIDHESI